MTEATSGATTSVIPRVGCQSCWFECHRRTCCFEFESMPASYCFCSGCRCSGACRWMTPSVTTSAWAGEQAPLLSHCWYSSHCHPCCSCDAGTCEDWAYHPRPPREPRPPLLLPPHLTHPGTTSSFSSTSRRRCFPWSSKSFVHRSECRSSCYCCEAEAEQTTQQSWMLPPPLRRWPRRLRRCPTRRRDPDPPTRDRRAWWCNWESLGLASYALTLASGFWWECTRNRHKLTAYRSPRYAGKMINNVDQTAGRYAQMGQGCNLNRRPTGEVQ